MNAIKRKEIFRRFKANNHRPTTELQYNSVFELLISVILSAQALAREPAIMSKVLGIVYRAIASYLIKRAGHSHKTAYTGAITLIQRFGSALNLNIHFHMLFLDGVYVKTQSSNKLTFKK